MYFWTDDRFRLDPERVAQLRGTGPHTIESSVLLDCDVCQVSGRRRVIHPQVHTEHGCVDELMEPLLRELWHRDVPTLFSCQEDDPAFTDVHSSGYDNEMLDYTVGYVITPEIDDAVRALRLIYDALRDAEHGWIRASVNVRSAYLLAGKTGDDRVVRGILTLPSPAITPLARLLRDER